MSVDEQDTKVSPDRFLDLLRCPISGARLSLEEQTLVSADKEHRYPISPLGIPLFSKSFISSDSHAQRLHYDKISEAYTANLDYPHTQEYLGYLDRAVLRVIGEGDLGTVAELCCGRGEGLTLLGSRIGRYLGIDVSENMLKSTLKIHDHPNALFLQGDATRTPISGASIDNVVMLGGIHHVPTRAQLFQEIFRILKPGGRFFFREPVSDFVLWRALRKGIYWLSPLLNPTTERPLLYEETVPVLESVGFQSLHYRTHGFLGFCLFMNSDVLVFNRLFRFVPGIRAIVAVSARLDDAILALPGFGSAGLQVVGAAQKPAFPVTSL